MLSHGDLGETLKFLAGQIQAKHGLVVDVRANGGTRLGSDGIMALLYKTTQELLFNVVKHADVHQAKVQARRHGPCVCLIVSDRGRGFDPQRLRETAGFGLLNIRERIELPGGRMKVKSAQGKGSRLSITVPDGQAVVASPPSGLDLPQPGAAGLPPSSVLRVLLVDDHDVVREGLAALLQEAPGIEVVGEAPDGREAINRALELRPDVVIMDVSMPLLSGDQATRQIKMYLPQTRVIALSMYDDADKKQSMFDAGAEDYILKTISAEELIAAIRGRDPNS